MYELVIVGEEGDPHDAIRSLLHTTLTHMAEFQVKMLEVIGKRFSLKMEDMVEAIRDSQEFATKTLANEVIQSEVVEKVLKTKKGKKVIIKKEAS
jgi:phosphoribosylformylglycinamidine (FGAM) synthase PurS component